MEIVRNIVYHCLDNEFGEDATNRWQVLYVFLVLISTAVANVINKKFLSSTKISLIQMTHYSYLVALFGSIFIFFIECFVRKGEVPYPLLSLDGLYKAEEIINVIALNSVNELFSFIMMLYLARRTHIVRASVFGVIP